MPTATRHRRRGVLVPVTDVARVSGPHADAFAAAGGRLRRRHVRSGGGLCRASTTCPWPRRDGDLLHGPAPGRGWRAGGVARHPGHAPGNPRPSCPRGGRTRPPHTAAAGVTTASKRPLPRRAAPWPRCRTSSICRRRRSSATRPARARRARPRQRHARRTEVIALEERQAGEERLALDARQQEAAASIAALEPSSGRPTNGWPTAAPPGRAPRRDCRAGGPRGRGRRAARGRWSSAWRRP